MTSVPFPLGALDPCGDCGAQIPRLDATPHICDPERLLDHKVGRERDRLIQFEARLGEWLATREGRFEVFYAEWTRPPLERCSLHAPLLSHGNRTSFRQTLLPLSTRTNVRDAA